MHAMNRTGLRLQLEGQPFQGQPCMAGVINSFSAGGMSMLNLNTMSACRNY